MATPTSSERREEIELELMAFELVERKAELAIYVVVTIASAAATVASVLKGYPWPAPSAASVASTVALVLGHRRASARGRQADIRTEAPPSR